MDRRSTACGALINQVLVLFVATAVAVVIALVALRAGAAPLGTSAPDDAAACLQQTASSGQTSVSGLAGEQASAERTWLPLGLVCSIKGPDVARTASVVVYQSWPATITVMLAGFVALLGSLRLISLLRLFARTGRVFA